MPKVTRPNKPLLRARPHVPPFVDNFAGKFRPKARWQNFPLVKFRGVGRAIKMPMALHTIGLEQQIVSDIIN